MRRSIATVCVLASMLGIVATASADCTIPSSTMYFQGTLNDQGGGIYSGILAMIDEGGSASGYDIYAKNGATAWFGNDPGSGPVWTSGTIANHDAWPTWTPDTPDWYQYSLNLYVDGGQQKWALRNHPGATADHPWDDTAYWGSPKAAMGVPMSGSMDWMNMIATETDTGAYLPGTGIAKIPGGAAGQGVTAGAWDMDWSWGSELVPLQDPRFTVDVTAITGGYQVTLTPIPAPGAVVLGWIGLGLVGWVKRRFA